ncbi:class I SAM-dependent methyltransferase, partial [Patescibacteria group bacterium]|nr:class I SAM-dependent methyltransferase [Patescibacteria group bacterium]MBU1457784.1 class I SAM-dependent methyltransferase [Patescibacteria group bacterium]
MTIWDNIYKNHQKGGEAWATLSEEIDPIFKQFLSQSNFRTRHVLDIGCGTGKYLKFLQTDGFKTDGIDSSETAVKMTKRMLGNESKILYVNMFEFKIPKNQYDLIISISTIHHGTKREVQNLIDQIHETLIVNGKIFITLPDINTARKKGYLKNHEEVEKGSYAPLSG